MLTGELFYIREFKQEEGNVNARVELNAAHPVFEGHFPGQPVLPGVCMMQLVKELLEQAIGQKTRLSLAGQVKFLTVINPGLTKSVNAQISFSREANSFKVNAALSNEGVTYFKLNAVFVLQE